MLAALHKVPVSRGGCSVRPGGHACTRSASGITLIELQEPSDMSVVIEWRWPGLPTVMSSCNSAGAVLHRRRHRVRAPRSNAGPRASRPASSSRPAPAARRRPMPSSGRSSQRRLAQPLSARAAFAIADRHRGELTLSAATPGEPLRACPRDAVTGSVRRRHDNALRRAARRSAACRPCTDAREAADERHRTSRRSSRPADIVKTYGHVNALQGANFTVYPG